MKPERGRDQAATQVKGLALVLHPEKTKAVELAWGKEEFKFLGWYVGKCPSARTPGKRFLNRWPSPESMKKLYAKIRGVVRRQARVKDIREFVPKLNPVLRGWVNYFRTGYSRRKFEQVDRYTQRRRRTKPYWRAGRFNHAWYKSLGFFEFVRTGLVRYPGVAYAKV